MFQLLCCIRQSAALVQQWNAPQTIQLDKCNGKKGCSSLRLIHLLDPVGKSFFESIWDKCSPTTWDFAYGFTPGKRREATIRRRHGCSVHTGFFDVANACP